MSCGSSLILDISDKSESNIFKSLFFMIGWNKIASNFENNLVLPKAENYATGLAMLSNDIEDSQIYFASQFAASISKKQRSFIKLFIVILDVFQNNAFITEQKHSDNISEGDYVDQVWLPILKSLFATNGHLIRVKKVDVRLIYDHGASEFDIDVAEACLPEVDNSRVIDDSAELLREGKDNIDTLFKTTSIKYQYRHQISCSGFTTLPHTQQPSCQTWHTPPRKQQKRSVLSEANYELLETGKYTVVDDDTDANPPDDDDSENAKEDTFGFVKLMNGWYHPGLKKYFEQHPCG
ncbi:hypothetical protein BCV72DRAFT_256432 [Rhizopus microsporus var. microsporus]|uniref:Uncharacterized protein n=1 Tax=Rhizopus microsporus var. microsporus TaxID=86635 RepID=A0A1X0R2K2_RHIZD|nr:hypothetical protein BCV72DRAFT_256432 [Rhizopus microsporus var. microsporus]